MCASDLQHALASMFWLAAVTASRAICGIVTTTCCVTALRRPNLVAMNIDLVWLQVRGARIVLRVVSLLIDHLAKHLELF